MLRRLSTAVCSLGRHQPKKGDKVVVALSGGVDSSVAALQLAKEDYDLSAIYMRNWDTADEAGSDLAGCQWKKEWEDAQNISKFLGLPIEMIDLSLEYWNRVFEPALVSWQAGLTPNPDVTCNREIKFGALMSRLPKLGSDGWLATGHYADIRWTSWEGSLRPQLVLPKDLHKDQTYYLSNITESSLTKAIFPLHSLTKMEVRNIAARAGLPSAEREESMGLCFVGEKRRFGTFLANYLAPKNGPIVNHVTNETLGEHNGLWNYTIGQGARLPGMSEKMFVAVKDVSSNTLRIVPGSSHDALTIQTVVCSPWTWIWANSPPSASLCQAGFKVTAKYRHRMKRMACSVVFRPEDATATIVFDQPQIAVAAGQTVAVWDGDWCLGSGIILNAT